MKITEINASTQEVIERDMTAEELTQAEADKASAEATKQANQEEKAKAEAKRLVALAKLEALGLDENDLKALGL
jgi:FMN-dependent NADH-azoreductase